MDGAEVFIKRPVMTIRHGSVLMCRTADLWLT